MPARKVKSVMLVQAEVSHVLYGGSTCGCNFAHTRGSLRDEFVALALAMRTSLTIMYKHCLKGIRRVVLRQKGVTDTIQP